MENFTFKKRFGQNFLNNKEILKKIVFCAEVYPNSLIMEVGPGSGNLTYFLADTYKDSQVLAYEIDYTLKDVLEERFKDFNNVKIVFEDFLKIDLEKELSSSFHYENLYFVSNIPYYITTPIIFKLIESKLKFKKIVLLVQKEVGERFCSKTGSKSYGALTVILNYYFNIKKDFLVDRNQFTPRPNVDSVVVSFSLKEHKEHLNNEKEFLKLVHESFKFKRKMLRNNLKQYDLEKIEEVLKLYNYDLTVRAEELDYKIFVAIANKLF